MLRSAPEQRSTYTRKRTNVSDYDEHREAALNALAFAKDAEPGGPAVVMAYAQINATLAVAAALDNFTRVYDEWQAKIQ